MCCAGPVLRKQTYQLESEYDALLFPWQQLTSTAPRNLQSETYNYWRGEVFRRGEILWEESRLRELCGSRNAGMSSSALGSLVLPGFLSEMTNEDSLGILFLEYLSRGVTQEREFSALVSTPGFQR